MVDLQAKSIEMWREEAWKWDKRYRDLKGALLEIKAMHHEGGVDDVQERDDRTYFIVCKALGEEP